MTYGPLYKLPAPFRNKLDTWNAVVRTLFLCSTVIVVLGFFFFSYWTTVRPPSSIAPPTLISKLSSNRPTLIKDEFIQKKENPATREDPPEFIQKKENPATREDPPDLIVEEKVEFSIETVERGVAYSNDWSISTVQDPSTEDENEFISAVSKKGISWDDPKLDILHMQKPEFNARFKNPCWYEPLQSSNPYNDNRFTLYSPAAKDTLAKLTDKWEELYENKEEPKRLRCLPYFLIIGQPKCGSTDLFWKVAKHPDIDTPPIKELHWWSRNRQGRRFSYSQIIPFDDYVDMFDKVALKIEDRAVNLSLPSQLDPETSTQVITGEASVSVLWDNNEWYKFPENWNRQEPIYINPHYVHHIIPDVKLIVILREPVERMYSDYLYFRGANKSAEDFHRVVMNAVNCYTSCMEKHSARYCVYRNDVANRARVRLRVGLYSVFLKDWFSLFPKQQFFILRLEDYSKDRLMYTQQIYKFLGVRDLNPEEEKLISDSPISNARKAGDREIGGMHEDTHKLLRDFYRPFNIELAKLLQDKRFLWLDKS